MKTKPEKPKKKIVIRRTATFDAFDWTCKKVAIGFFLNWVEETVPKGADDITLELQEGWDLYDYSGSPNLELAWNEKVDNPYYEQQMKSYQKKLKKWKEQ
jgi:hypothetical protein